MAFGFEPRYSKHELDERRKLEDNRVNENFETYRLNDTHWCKCENCKVMATPKECLCCVESDMINTIRNENKCITYHDAFENVILNLDSLNILRHNIILKCTTQDEKKKYLNESNKLWRHLAYKNFVSWINCWTSIGRHNRIVIPSCVVQSIRSKFPEINEDYTGFKEYDLL